MKIDLNIYIKQADRILIRWTGKASYHGINFNDVTCFRELEPLQIYIEKLKKYVGFADVCFDMDDVDELGKKTGWLVDIMDGEVLNRNIPLPQGDHEK